MAQYRSYKKLQNLFTLETITISIKKKKRMKNYYMFMYSLGICSLVDVGNKNNYFFHILTYTSDQVIKNRILHCVSFIN